MTDHKPVEAQLRDFYGTDVYVKLKDKAREKFDDEIELTLREDIILHPENYDSFTENLVAKNKVPRAVQRLYRDTIRNCVNMMRNGNLMGKVTIDNIFVNAGGRYTLNHEESQTLYPESLYRLAQKLHPKENDYPGEFKHFLQMLVRVNNDVNNLRKLYYHPPLLTDEEIGEIMCHAYPKFSHRAETYQGIWTDLEERIPTLYLSIETHIDDAIKRKVEAAKFFKDVYNEYREEYLKNGKGFIYYYRFVFQHLNETVERHNREEHDKYLKKKDMAEEKAIEDYESRGIDNPEQRKYMVAKAAADVPPNVIVPFFSRREIVEMMEVMFPRVVLLVYIFMIEQGIEFNEDENPITLVAIG